MEKRVHYNLRHHLEMLEDKVRCEAYQQALAQTVSGKVVLDVGCGTGILSFFAARAGAKKVLAVDMALPPGIEQVAEDNGLKDKIRFFAGRIEEISLPVAAVDVIVSEWMGGLLFMENMLPAVLYARDRWLKPDGLLLPDKASLFLAPLADSAGISSAEFPVLRRSVSSKIWVAVIDPQALSAEPCCVTDLDLKCVKPHEIESFTKKFQFEFSERGTFDSCALWFDVEFTCCQKKVMLSTAPWSATTHWQQALSILPRDIRISRGHRLTGRFTQKNVSALRIEYDVVIHDQADVNSRERALLSFQTAADSASFNPTSHTDAMEISQAVAGAYRGHHCIWIGCSWADSPFLAAKNGAREIRVLNHSAWARQAMSLFVREEGLDCIQFIDCLPSREDLTKHNWMILGSADGSWQSLISHIKLRRLIGRPLFHLEMSLVNNPWTTFYGFDFSEYSKHDLEMTHEQIRLMDQIDLVDRTDSISVEKHVVPSAETIYRGEFYTMSSKMTALINRFNCVKIDFDCGCVVLPVGNRFNDHNPHPFTVESGILDILVDSNQTVVFHLILKNKDQTFNQTYQQPLNYLGRIM